MRDKVNIAESFYTKVLLCKAWSALKKHIQEEADIKTRKATEYYDRSIKRRIFNSLRHQVMKNTEKRKIMATKQEIVDRFFNNKKLRMAFDCLAKYCNTKKEKKLKLKQAEEYFRTKYLSSYFNNWKITLQNRIHFNELEVCFSHAALVISNKAIESCSSKTKKERAETGFNYLERQTFVSKTSILFNRESGMFPLGILDQKVFVCS